MKYLVLCSILLASPVYAIVGGGTPSSRIGGQAWGSTEWLLKKNTLYAVQFISMNNNNQCVIDVEYYENGI